MVPSNNSNTPSFTTEQSRQLTALWKSFSRELVDIRVSSENSDKFTIPQHAYSFTYRLHTFLFEALVQTTAAMKQKLDNNDNNSIRHQLQYPSLTPYMKFALDHNNEVRLQTGRQIISLHHEEFLQDVNKYESKSATPSEEFVRKESFGAFLYHLPELALQALGCAMALVTLASTKHNVDKEYINHYIDSTKIVVRFSHLQPKLQMIDIKTGLVGKLLSIKGHVVKARPKRLCVATADFRCTKCSTLQTHSFDQGGRYSTPKSCINSECRGRTFIWLRSTSKYINSQEIRLQEVQEENHSSQAGRTPRQIEIELSHDLVDMCRPGDVVLMAGIVTAINTAIAAGQTGRIAKETSTYKLYLQGHSIVTMSESNQRKEQDTQQLVYTQQQLSNITQLCHADHKYFGLQERRAFPFDLLVRSICPSIIGHNEVKAGLLLCLLGGTPPSSSDKSGNSIRCNSHALICGDPGMGKSQMILAVTQLATRSVYVGGNTSSTTGLTVTLTKEERGESGIEAGALVLADQGVCAIDEFDKMAKNQQDGLLEAMEQQQVSIAKAGVVASLPARCSVVAAANPKHGSYNMSKTVSENLNMAKPILSRFDLVFILRDRADKAHDKMISSNIMDLYRNKSTVGAANHVEKQRSENTASNKADGRDRMALAERLAWVTDFQKEPLPANLVKDYIAYAREYCKPKLTPEAAAVLKNYFMELRYPTDQTRNGDSVPITTRQLEAMIRLSQARAKACLRDFVLREDALDVVELMNISVEQVHSDEGGVLDKSRGGAGGNSNRKMKKAFVQELQRVVGVGAECSFDDMRRIATKVNCGLNDFSGMIEDLRNTGILMKKSNGRYQVLS